MRQGVEMNYASAMTLPSQSDEDLVDAARDGDDRAFEELYGRYRQRIKAFALRLTRNPDRADDVTQEVFISALRRLRQTTGQVAFRPWIYEIARNACIDEYRRNARNQEIPIERDGVDGWLAALATAPPPEAAIESKQQLDDLCGAFRGLSERHHRIIVLREFEGLSYSQIGDQLGISKMVVESTLFRARRRLTEEYEDLTSGRRCEFVRQTLEARERRPFRQLGIRDRRALSQHLEHCRPCRREAALHGITPEPSAPRVVQKVAAFVPVPLLVLLRRSGVRAQALVRTAHHALSPVGSSAASYAGPVAAIAGSGRIATTAATLVLAVVGGGVIGDAAAGSDNAGRTAAARVASATGHDAGFGAAGLGSLGSGGSKAATGGPGRTLVGGGPARVRIIPGGFTFSAADLSSAGARADTDADAPPTGHGAGAAGSQSAGGHSGTTALSASSSNGAGAGDATEAIAAASIAMPSAPTSLRTAVGGSSQPPGVPSTSSAVPPPPASAAAPPRTNAPSSLGSLPRLGRA